jgi:hypothetical protein
MWYKSTNQEKQSSNQKVVGLHLMHNPTLDLKIEEPDS